MSEFELDRCKDGVEVKCKERNDTDNLEFPSKWFQDHPEQKPQVVREVKDPKEWKEVRGKILENLDTGRLTSKEAVAFMIYFAKTYMTVTASIEFKSFGLVLWSKDDDTDPTKLVDIIDSQILSDFSGTKDRIIEGFTDEMTDFRIILHILCIYRLARINRKDYRRTVAEKMKVVFNFYVREYPMSLLSNVVSYRKWIKDPNYTKMIAAYDMFLNYHGTKLSQFQFLRLGTLSSYYRDCSALVSFERITDGLSFSPAVMIGEWIFLPKLADSFRMVTKEGEELTKRYSYTPYCRDFHLVKKSPFSANANPEFHLFLHTAGVLYGERWSRNAQLIEVRDAYNVCLNGLILAYGYEKLSVTRLAIHFRILKDKQELPEDREIEAPQASTSLPNVLDFRNYMKIHENLIQGDLREFLVGRLRAYTDVREDTIVYYLKNNFAQKKATSPKLKRDKKTEDHSDPKQKKPSKKLEFVPKERKGQIWN